MASVERPFPPGDYDAVVVGSGPGGLQTSYWLRRHGVRHAVISRDDAPAGMFRRLPIFQRLITWTKPDAPVARTSREYEWYDHNSLIAAEPELKALVPALMDRAFDVPSRAEMQAGIEAFAARAGIEVRYGCTWDSTRHDGDRITLETSDGEYRCRAVVFAVGVTEPWRAPVPGLEHAAHYVDTANPERYAGRSVFVVGKRNSGFEVAQGILPWARSIVLGSPRPVQTEALARSALRVRYLHPYDEYARGGPGTYVLDVRIERVERRNSGFRVVTQGTTWDGRLEFDVDAVIAATGFRTPLRDLPRLGLVTVNDGRVPALTPFWESVSLPGVYFAGNASQGAKGLAKRGAGASSTAVNGFRYNALVLAQHLAETLTGRERPRAPVPDLASFVLGELSRAPELWVQKGYLCRVAASHSGGFVDEGLVPLAHFLDAAGPDAVAASVEVDDAGRIVPTVYVRRGGEITEHAFPPHPLNEYEAEPYRSELSALLAHAVG
ncbi:MAG TPA: NAD(P)-binding domain-containing protein [Gaiellaceae bacterium]|nr:NAD(P)-binding domain-containing protein [Gaiellaceae bacterium]